ncbi:MAG: exodeoxyribonuclease VII large subunit [Deltaproteobacteria bacterium]|nr:exodeoxyribonuclease VII large subunit [Deltaproteobacteria bacterium]
MNDSDTLFEYKRPRIYTVSALTEEIKNLLEERFDFVWVEAEISNFRSPSSGHYYLVLKDQHAQIRAVMFRPQTRYLKFMPEDGMNVIAQGRINLYQPRGEYQIVLDYLEPLGVGALALAFEQLKRKLAGQGVFDPAVKRPLPFLPQKVAVITSPTGAAIRDFLKVIHRRFTNVEINIIPVKVQGDEAAAEMVNALNVANQELDVDLIVLTRGGGSMEDLWAFNNEALALAIRASRIPVVSAVGHEIDITIADLAADLRAPTPSAAAELIVSEKAVLTKHLDDLKRHLWSGIRSSLQNMNQRLTLLSKSLRDPGRELADSWLRLDDLHHRLLRLIRQGTHDRKKALFSEHRALLLNAPLNMISSWRQKLGFSQRSLLLTISRRIKDDQMNLTLKRERISDLNPLSILKRGYSITRTLPDKTILKHAASIDKGAFVNILLAEGELDCRVEKTIIGGKS